MPDDVVTREEMAEMGRNLKAEIKKMEEKIPSVSSLTAEMLNQTPPLNSLDDRIKALEESTAEVEQTHPSSMCFQDTCEPCKAHLSHVVQQARKGLLAELGQASRWAGLEQEAGTVVEGYQRWEKEGRPAAADNKPKEDKKDGVTIDLGGGRTVDVPPE